MDFIFGGDTGTDYATLQRKRQMIEALQKDRSGVQRGGIGGAIEQVGKALLARHADKKLSGKENEARSNAEQIMQRLMGRSAPPVNYGAKQPPPQAQGFSATGTPAPPVTQGGPMTPEMAMDNYAVATDQRDPGMGFEQRGSDASIGQRLMMDLQRDFGLSQEQAAGFVGNLDHESAGFKQLQEMAPVVPGSRGGFGFAQWTGPRRKQFEAWASQNGLNPSSYEANYGFLKHELENTSEGRVLDPLRKAQSVDDAALVVQDRFLRPGIPHTDSRISRSRSYLGGGASEGTGSPQPAPPQNNRMALATQLLNNPYASDAQRMLAQSVMAQAMQPQAQMSPTDMLRNKKLELEIAQMQDGPKPTTAMRNFEYSQENPEFAEFTTKNTPQTNVNVAVGENATTSPRSPGVLAKELSKDDAEYLAAERDRARAAEDLEGLSAQMGVLSQDLGYTGPGGELYGAIDDAVGVLPGDSGSRGAFQSLGTEAQLTFTAKTKGAITEREMALFARAVPSLGRTPEANRRISEILTVASQRVQQRQQFMEDYLAQKGTLDGAERTWDRFYRENPIMVEGEDGKIATQGIGDYTRFLSGNPQGKSVYTFNPETGELE